MSTKVSLKIKDDVILRRDIDMLYDEINHVKIAEWSILLAKHILEIASIDYNAINEIIEGFKVNELWQIGQAKMHGVRQSGFKIHKIARESKDEIKKTALRVVGHAVASGHMKEHAMVASDYAVKTIGLICENDAMAITNERIWQLKALQDIHNRQ